MINQTLPIVLTALDPAPSRVAKHVDGIRQQINRLESLVGTIARSDDPKTAAAVTAINEVIANLRRNLSGLHVWQRK